ncbi:nitrogenase molybdenum-iron protein alpha chain [Desulfurispirillum indicum S5]|uniref:Nitrogenase protein alpha chain n=1 Tax=Desulfurispirillum indicum (strain ATCC BAA-1389 / DSM 22839 / S5) TaxID=653733 RepID=E6W1I0_DESIS|nr:nitrogenase molybdenum-iron protein alpha chain [Desulfurispirillum indicum]ADU65436.1 nitrogenase molybdenum-iron protein alpha chain [Desulfurispirillum indicum S5]
MSVVDKEQSQALIEEILQEYPEKALKSRKKHMTVVEPGADEKCGVSSNRKSIPGVMTIRGCAYAGSKGVVWGPVKDMLTISHGPVGCGQYSWATRRNYYTGITGVDSFGAMQITSDFQERDIVFGGDKKLEKLVDELEEMFPLSRGISIQSECPIGLIGDDIEAVSRKKAEEIGKPVVPVRCEGFRGVSQSLGHHIANDALRDWIYEKDVPASVQEAGPYDVALMADYNIGGDAWSSRRILEEMGLNVISQSTGDSTVAELANTAKAKLVLLHCYRSMNYIARYLEEKHSVPWTEFNFFGPTQIFKSMRKIASYFDESIQKRTEELIENKYKPLLQSVVDKYKSRLEGKKVMLYVGGLRPRHTIPCFKDLGVEVMLTGYEFGHGDDYQRTMEYLDDTTIVVDDMSEFEMEKFLSKLKPDLFGSGVKEKYQCQKAGVPFRQMHSWDYSGPYHGIEGFAIFARDMDMAINGQVWKHIKAPWKS